MKLLLAMSIVVNLVLSYLLLTRKPEKEVIERLIIEEHASRPKPLAPEPPQDSVPPELKKKKNAKPDEAPELVGLHDAELQDAGEKMEADRTEFLTGELGLSEDQLSEISKAREDFFKETSRFWKKNPMHELSFDDRRKMMKMEEDLYGKLEKIYGKKNWQRYQKYREQYNEKGYKKQLEDGKPFIFMGL